MNKRSLGWGFIAVWLIIVTLLVAAGMLSDSRRFGSQAMEHMMERQCADAKKMFGDKPRGQLNSNQLFIVEACEETGKWEKR